MISGKTVPIAVANMKLDKTVEPLPIDSKVIVRSRSALGLKYIQITPGHSQADVQGRRHAPAGELDAAGRVRRLPQHLRHADASELAARAHRLRRRVRRPRPATQPGDPGPQPVLHVPHAGDDQPVRPAHPAEGLLQAASARSRQVAPVAQRAGAAVREDGRHVRARSRAARAASSRRSRRTRRHSTRRSRSFRVQRPFLADFTDLSRRLQPAARVLPIGAAAAERRRSPSGTPRAAADRRPEQRHRRTSSARSTTSCRTRTRCSRCGDLRDTLAVTKPVDQLRGAVPDGLQLHHQLLRPASASTSPRASSDGTAERVLLKTDNGRQDNRFNNVFNDRPADVPDGRGPDHARRRRTAMPLEVAPRRPVLPGDRRAGQRRLPERPVRLPARARSARAALPRRTARCRRRPELHPVQPQLRGRQPQRVPDDTPGLAGTTFTGVKNLRDVP